MFITLTILAVFAGGVGGNTARLIFSALYQFNKHGRIFMPYVCVPTVRKIVSQKIGFTCSTAILANSNNSNNRSYYHGVDMSDPAQYLAEKDLPKKEGEHYMASNTEKKLNGTVIVTYRCNARCSMCNRYKAPSKPEEELAIETIKKLPKMYFTNITGGEPFIRTDLPDIVRELYKKSDRIVISTNGFFTDRIVALAKEFPQIGIRISIEGLEATNNEIRGLENGYQRGYQTLKKLREMGMKDVGFGMTVQDKNAPDLVPLYDISDEMGMEFATASLHNSFYFVEAKNIIHDRPMVAQNFEALINKLLKIKI